MNLSQQTPGVCHPAARCLGNTDRFDSLSPALRMALQEFNGGYFLKLLVHITGIGTPLPTA
ncbi:hypothetical protein [Ideonella livida]|uniref:Uncharacterized protein n=1 Tax=Ideonella livida TaxID=2707176 RepID=A0A7C9PI72_9BURK|nr:hypothetical protein [Ideonella livida]NDY91812.1 hypothetical protein [Ideonella livida]